MTEIEEAAGSVARLVERPPSWLAGLRDVADPVAGVEWLHVPEPYGDDDGLDGIMHTEATARYGQENRPYMVRLASGPRYPGKLGFDQVAAWCVDARAPGRLLLSASSGFPPFLWIPAEPTPEGMRRALDGFFPSPRPMRTDMPKTARGFMGYANRLRVPNVYSGEFVPIDGHELDRYYTLNTFTEGQSWGSSVSDDPYPDQPVPPIQTIGLSREVAKQGPGVPSMTWRTTVSGSYLSIEAHQGSLLVAEARYRPSPSPEVIENCNAEFGSAFPTDLPVDVVGALIGFGFDRLEFWEQELAGEEDPGHILGKLEIAAALAYGDLDAVDRLRPYFSHDDRGVRIGLMNIALAYNLEFLLEELLLTEPDEVLAGQVQQILDQGTGDVHRDLFEEGADEYEEEQDS